MLNFLLNSSSTPVVADRCIDLDLKIYIVTSFSMAYRAPTRSVWFISAVRSPNGKQWKEVKYDHPVDEIKISK